MVESIIDRLRGPSTFLRYGLAVLAVPVATIIQLFGDRDFAVTPSYFCAVLLTAWFGGLGPGLFAIALSIPALMYYFVPPTRTFSVDAAHMPSLILFSLAALFVTWLSVRERNATKSLVYARDQLDIKLRELEKSNEALQDEFAARAHAEEELDQLRSDLAHVTRVMTLGELAASIAHEVKQPMSAMIINAQAALRWLAHQPPDVEETRQLLDRIVTDGHRASNVVGRIRDLTRKAAPRMERMDINPAIGEVIELTRSEVVKNGISTQIHLAEDLPVVQADRTQLQQVILNLIVNAVQALTDRCDSRRELLISTSTNDSGEVLVSVCDSGPGITPENLGHVFDPFYTTKRYGMGIGLSICRSIVEGHGGRIWATVNDPQGAVFHVTLPAA
jgi:C4-dicarboxylate-specific signal transduction histidine kinase